MEYNTEAQPITAYPSIAYRLPGAPAQGAHRPEAAVTSAGLVRLLTQKCGNVVVIHTLRHKSFHFQIAGSRGGNRGLTG